MKINHTPGPWSQHGARIRRTAHAQICEVMVQREIPTEQIGGNAKLLALAPTAPHECGDPHCPGNVHRKRLEVYEELLSACREAQKALLAYGPSTQDDSLWNSVLHRLHTVLAKTEG